MPTQPESAPEVAAAIMPMPVRIESNLACFLRSEDATRLSSWRRVYEELEAQAKSDNTKAAKHRDLDLFTGFFHEQVGTDYLDDWTKPVTTGFLRYLETTGIRKGDKEIKRKAATVNRIFSTIRHFAAWVQARRAFLAGNPCIGVKELVSEDPAWKGISDNAVMRLRSAAEQLVKLRVRDNQSPVRDKTVFLVLLNTGLRVSELVALDRRQVHGKHLTDVKRKGKLRNAKIFLPKDAKDALDEYLAVRGDRGGPLFLTRSGNRLSRQDVDWSLRTLANQANANHRDKDNEVRFSAHTLRHTFLRKVASKHGVEFAMQAAGHASSKYIWRYVQPSEEQREQALEDLF